jgi:hypothetical protein
LSIYAQAIRRDDGEKAGCGLLVRWAISVEAADAPVEVLSSAVA